MLAYWSRSLVVLPARWLVHNMRATLGQRQRCKRCGQTSSLDFTTSDATWAAIVPPRWRRFVVCLACFERFANDRGQHVVRVFLVNGP